MYSIRVPRKKIYYAQYRQEITRRASGDNLTFAARGATKKKDYSSVAYLDDSDKESKLFENQAKLLVHPVCRNGKSKATVGMAQKVWEGWR